MTASIEIAPAVPSDWPEIWRIFRHVIEEGETYSYGEESTEEWAREYWTGANVSCFAAKENGKLLGCYALRPSRVGRGSHIANASYMVAPEARGKGIGRMLGEHSIAEARRRGYHGMVYNFVVSTNEKAVKLWKSLGFQIIGTLPKGFRSKSLGLVDAYMMYQPLQ